MSTIHVPNTSLAARINRRLMPFCAQRKLAVKLKKPIVSFTFDDCPKSVCDNALPLLEKENWRASIYMAMGLCDTTNHLGLHMSADDVKAVNKNGHEIADHTYDHIDVTEISLSDLEANIEKNQASLNALGISPSETFAYPYGQLNLPAKKMVQEKFIGSRGITSATHSSVVDLNQIGSNRLYSGQSTKNLLRDIEALTQKAAWLTIFTHDVRDNPSEFGCRPEDLESIITAVKNVGAEVMTVANAIKFLEIENDQ